MLNGMTNAAPISERASLLPPPCLGRTVLNVAIQCDGVKGGNREIVQKRHSLIEQSTEGDMDHAYVLVARAMQLAAASRAGVTVRPRVLMRSTTHASNLSESSASESTTAESARILAWRAAAANNGSGVEEDLDLAMMESGEASVKLTNGSILLTAQDLPRAEAWVTEMRTRFGPLPTKNTNKFVGKLPLGDFAEHFAIPFYRLVSTLAHNVLVHGNLVAVSNVIRAAASRMDKVPVRRTLMKSGDFFETLAALNTTLKDNRRLTGVTMVILQMMYMEEVSPTVVTKIDQALNNVIALRRWQLERAAQRNGTRAEAEAKHRDDTHDGSGAPILPDRRNIWREWLEDIDEDTTTSASLSTASPNVEGIPYGSIAARQNAMPKRISRIHAVAKLGRADAGALMGHEWSRTVVLDSVPLVWTVDRRGTRAWRLVPLEPYEVCLNVPTQAGANASVPLLGSSAVPFTLAGQLYLAMFGATFAVAPLTRGALWVVGPHHALLPPLPLVQNNDTWTFVVPNAEDEVLPDVGPPSEDGFVRWQNKKYICYDDRMREVDRSAIDGEERIREFALSVPDRLDAPDHAGILHTHKGQHLVEGQHGYYDLFDGGQRGDPEGYTHRVAYQGRASMAEMRFDVMQRRWYVVGAQATNSWFSNVMNPAKDLQVAHRLLNAGLAMRLDASRRALPEAPFLQARGDLLEGIESNVDALLARILRFQTRPAIFEANEQESLYRLWSGLTDLLPAPEEWAQLTLIERQRLSGENLALFYDEFASDFPLSGMLHQVQMTALGMNGLAGALAQGAVLQMSWMPAAQNATTAFATDFLLYSDIPAMLTTLMHPSRDDTQADADEVDVPTRANAKASRNKWIALDAPIGDRAAFLAWLYHHRASVALINFSSRGGICSFEHAATADEVGDVVDVFLLDRPVAEGRSYNVSYRDPMRSGYV